MKVKYVSRATSNIMAFEKKRKKRKHKKRKERKGREIKGKK